MEPVGIHGHVQYKLGKGEAKQDKRNLRMRAVLKAVKIPKAYDADAQFSPRPQLPMFMNDRLGCCVISARAHQSLRFEFKETGAYPQIADGQVQAEYFRESGGRDSGLVILDSLKSWRKQGWYAGGKLLKIDAYAQVNQKDQNEVSTAIFADVGVQVGVELPISAQDQLDAGKRWTVASGSRARAGTWGGHCMLAKAYDATGICFVTWGRLQWADWAWWAKYCSEAYATFDAANTAKASVIRRDLVAEFVSHVDASAVC